MRLRRKGIFGAGKRSVYFAVLFFISIFMGIGYSFLNSTLNIVGSSSITKNTWDVHFENVKVASGSVDNGTYTLQSNSTVLNFTASLDNPGDFYEFGVDISNSGSIDAMISDVVKSGLTSAQSNYLEYIVTYTDDSQIKSKDLLPAGNKERIQVKVKYRDDVAEEVLPDIDQSLELQLNLTYIQADSTAVAVVHPICKRAKVLHEETCNNDDVTYYCSGVSGYEIGDTIYYGNLGTIGTLAAGDAFDCDVNGDKEYDADTERFYYISNLDTNSNYAVLIYYSNVLGGVSDNTSAYAYDLAATPRENGPVTLLSQLPTTSQWSNVSLSNTTRKIKDELGSEYINFSYNGYAARILTITELNTACNITTANGMVGELAPCNYLMENTDYSDSTSGYGYWLETPRSSDAARVFRVNGKGGINGTTASSQVYNAARPVIEVLKSKISY